MLVVSPKDGEATDQVVGEVMAHQAFSGSGSESGRPGDGH